MIRRVNATNPDTNAWALFERNEVDTTRFDALFLEESTALAWVVCAWTNCALGLLT